MRKFLITMMCIIMVVCFMPTVAMAETGNVQTGYGADTLPTGPDMSGDIINVNADNIQYTLDGAYGSIDGKTIVLSDGDYGKIELGRATKYPGSNTDYYIGGIAGENKKTFNEFVDIKNNGQWSASAYYVRNMSNVTIKAVEGANVTVAGIIGTSGHVYGESYDYVLDKAYISGSAYYLTQNWHNITIEGITFTAKSDIASSLGTTVIDGVTFKNCKFNIDNTASGNQALRYYNENDNGNVKNLTVENCAFNNCFQGVYTQKINGIKVTDSTFDTTGHNAIAVQSGSDAVNHKSVVITDNTFSNIGDRIIRFGLVGADTQITIKNNTATNSGDLYNQVIKAGSLAEGVTYDICGNNWGEGKVVANPELGDKDAVAAINGLPYTSLQDAIAAATEGQTVTLLNGVTLSENLILNTGREVILDLNNNSINAASNYIMVTHGNLDIKGEGEISSSNPNYAFKLVGSESDVADYSVLTIGKDVTVNSNGYGVMISGRVQSSDPMHYYGTKVTINGTINSTYGIYVNGQINKTEGNVPIFNVNDSAEINGGGLYAAGYAIWNLAGDITGEHALSLKAGTFTISGGSYTSTGEYINPGEDTSNGSVETGAALSMTSNDGYAHKVDVTVNGGTFTSTNGHAVYEGIPNKKGTSIPIASQSYVTLEINGGTFISATGKDSVFLTKMNNKKVVNGGRFSTDVSDYKAPSKHCTKESTAEDAMYLVHDHNTTCNFGHVYCPATCKDANGAEMCHTSSHYVAPPTTPTTPTDNVTNSGTIGTDNAATNADLSGSTSTSNGTTSATVDKTTADKIVDKVVENKSTEVVIDATANTTTAANSTTIAQVTIPTETLGAIAEKTEADVTIKTDVAEVKMDNAAAAAVSEQAEGDTVQIIAEKVAEETDKVEFELKVVCSDGKVISNFNGGNIAVTVALPKAMAEKKVVCVYIDDNGHMSKVEGQKNADGTYTFVTGHFSSYAILAEEEADAAIAAQKEAIKNIKIKLTSKQVKTKAGKKAVKIAWTADAGDKVLDGVEVFRSTERYKGYGTEPFYTSTKGGNTGSYTNTKSLKKGTKYYYRVRGYVLVNGEKVYTDYSTKAWRTVK